MNEKRYDHKLNFKHSKYLNAIALSAYYWKIKRERGLPKLLEEFLRKAIRVKY